MAERIEQRIEDRIPELEQLERVGLFTRKEVRAIIKKASALEYKIQRRALHKEDFISYIQYEINLLELIKKRRLRIGYSFKKEEIEYSIVQRIHSIFKRATAKWKEDLQLWLSHVAFCKKWNKKIQLSKLFSSMLALHPNKPALWIMAAKWEMEDRLSSESARQLFLRALRFHPESPKLYQEYFRMELMHAEKQRKEKKEFEQAKLDLSDFSFSEDILNGEMARIIYRNAIQKIKGAEFVLSLLSVAKCFDFTQDLQKEILENLQAEYENDPLVWEYMARRELEMESLPSSGQKSKQSKALDVAHKEEQCCTVFEEAITHLPTEEMWKCYVAFCLERFNRKTNSEELRQKRLERVLSVFSRAHELQLLPASLYKQWLQILLELDQQDKAKEVVATATKQFSQLVDVWEMRLQLLLELKSNDVASCFQEAFKVINAKDSLALWALWLEWSENISSKTETEALYQKSLHAVLPADSVALKEKYLTWAYRTGGYKKAKQVFNSLHECRPLSLQFFKKMIQIEKEGSNKIFNIREYYERALREFGATEPDLWLDYIREERNHFQGKPENCGSIHWRAMKMLQGEQVETFISKYTLLQAGHIISVLQMKVNGSALAGQEEVEVKREKTFIWRPRKVDLTESEVEQVSSPEDSDHFEDSALENEDWDPVFEGCSTSHFPEMTPVSTYEEEDWDKELADTENSNNPYDLDDIIPCGGILDGNSEALYTVQESLYDPSLYHVAPLILSPLKAVTEDGQFEDALDCAVPSTGTDC